MYVCICAAVTDGTIRQSVASGNTKWKALCQELHIAQTCGKCGPCAMALFEESLAAQTKRDVAALTPQI